MTVDNRESDISPNPLRASFRKALRTALKRCCKKIEKLSEELAETSKAEYYLECGEIIKANLSVVKRGSFEVELPDMYTPGQTRVIPLEAHLKPLDNAKKYFKKQRKLIKGKEVIEQQLDSSRQILVKIEDLLAGYLEWEENSDIVLAPKQEYLDSAIELKIHIAGTQVKKKVVSKRKQIPDGVRLFESYDGMVIYVGKNARDNDNLSIRFARGNDWWFHVAGVQGSHVLVRTEKKADQQVLKQETILDAATLAVYFSKARKATRADVHYTQAKNIRKSKKAPAGQVIVNNGKTLNVRIEEKRLDRLLKREVDKG